MNKIKTFDEIREQSRRHRAEGRTIVFTNGCFDILHIGHIHCLERAKAEGDLLVVGLNSDASVRALKGPARPIVPEQERAEMLAALAAVDYVVLFDELRPVRLIETVHPHVHAKGGDYRAEELPEAPLLKALGARIAIIPIVEGHSTTELISRTVSLTTTPVRSHPASPVVWCVIPARYGSTRLEGKALLPIGDKPMIQHVFERAKQAKTVTKVLVATDDERIQSVVEGFGGKVVMTSRTHRSGTDRIAEAIKDESCDLVVNVQGDEPFIDPSILDEAVRPLLQDSALMMSTLMTPITSEGDLEDPNVVKVVTDQKGYALYFSRFPVPFVRVDGEKPSVFRHIGLYVYRKDFLLHYSTMKPTPLEKAESLEQLRVLENGYRIKVIETQFSNPGVDTPEDLERVRELYRCQER